MNLNILMIGIFYSLHALGLFKKKWQFKKNKIESLFNQHTNCLEILRRWLRSESGSTWHLVTRKPERPTRAGCNSAEIRPLSNSISHVRTLKIIPWINFLFRVWISIFPTKLGGKEQRHLSPLHLNLAFLTIQVSFLNCILCICGEPLLNVSSDLLKATKHLLKQRLGKVSLFIKP